MRELPAPEKKAPERIDTGLMEAFGEVNGNGAAAPAQSAQSAESARRPRGRPAGVPNKPRPAPVIEHEAAPPPAPTATEPAAGVADGEEWEESDTDLDDTVAKLMGDKVNKMMK
jgi:hypothetical protein